MADGDKKWWQVFKRDEPTPPDTATQEPEYYRKEKGIDPKLEFQEQRDKLIHHPDFERMTDPKKREALNLFFDTYGNRYLDQINQTDPGVREEVRKQWLERMYGEISGKVPEPTEQQKKTKIEDTYELPDWLQDGKNYQEVTQPVDNLRVATTRTPEDDKSVRDHYAWLSQEIPSVTDKLLNSDEFGYLKSRPDLFYQGGEESVKAVDKWLKDNTELGYTDRSYVQNYLNQKAKDEMTNVLKQKYTGNLAEDTKAAAEPYIDPERTGYLDPDTDTYTPEPQTKEATEFASLLDKSSNDLAALVLNSSGQSKMAIEKQKLADEYQQLEEEGQKLQQLEAENEKWAEGLTPGDEEYYQKYTEWITNANKARADYVKKIEAFNEKTNEFNQNLSDVPKEIPGNKSMEDRLNDYVQGAYLRWQNYEQQYNTAARQYRGEEESLKTPSTKTLAQLNKLRYQAKADFIAGSRMLYNQEGPLSIDRGKEYKTELFTTAVQRSLGWGKTGEKLSFFDEPRQKEILSNMYGIGQEVGMKFTPEELDAFSATMGERILEGTGSLLPDLPDLLLLGGVSGTMKGALNIGRWTKGYQIVRNKALGRAAVIGLDETPGTGWEVVRMFKPTKLQKVAGTVAGGILDEAVFSGVGGFQFGTITGMNATHALVPEIKLKGKYQMFNPILDIFTRSGAGATIGMEAGGAVAGLTESLLSDKPVDVSIQEHFPSVSETSQRVLEEFIVNSILFGGQGAIMKGVAKAKSAPAGMEFNRFGNMNWTGYLNPRVRARYYEAAKEFESKGFTDAATTLYNWLDLYKDPVKGSEIKQGRMESLEESLSILPTGQLREMRDVYGLSIKAMEYQSRQPGFTGELVIPIRSYTDVKPGSVVSTKETEMTEDGPKEKIDHWEVISRQDNQNGFPVKYEAVHTESGEKRTFEPKVSDIEGKRTTYFDFDPTVKFKLKNSLQVPFTLEAMYEHYAVLDKILLGRDINPPKMQIGPGSRGEVTPEGEFIPLPPEKTKIEKKREEIARREQEMREETGMEPIEMPEPKRVYSYGEPEKITEMGVGEFHDNVKGAYQERDDQIAALNEKIKGLRNDLATKWKGRLGPAERKERQDAENEIARTELAIEKLQTEWGGELRDFLGESQDYINNSIRGMVPGITDPEVKEIRDDLWQKLMGPEEGERSMTIEELIKATIDEKTAEGQGVVPEVQPTEGEEVQPPEEEVPEEKPEIAPEDLPMDVTEEEVTPTTEGERMREKGERTVLGVKYVRQPSLTKEAEGGVTNVRFSKKEAPEAIWTVMEMKDLQPSHLMGTENPRHFLPEAQPRNRANLKSLADAAREKSQNLDPEQLMFSPNAYTGAPVVNERGEVIQGNGRAEALIYYYQTTARDPKGYKKKLAKELENLGLAKTDLDKFEEPVLVRKMYVPDDIAIRLGNFGMRDLEDVQEETSNIKQASNRMTPEQGVSVSNILLKGNEADDTLNDLIRKNAGELLQKLTEYDVFSQGDAERFRRGGEITPEGINAIQGVVKGLFFKGGNVNLPEIFEELPHVVKKGIEKSMPILLRIPAQNNLLPQVRNALMGLYEYDQYLRSTGETSAFPDWIRQTSMYEAPVQERFTPLELAMIEKFATAKRQSDIVRAFMDYENLVKGKAASLFEGASEGIPRSQATEQVFGQPYEKTIDDEYEEVTEVPTEREGEVPGPEPTEGEGAEKEPPVQRVNVQKDLDDMVGLLGDIDFGGGPVEGAGGTMDADPAIKMLTIAQGVVKKMTEAGIYGFDEMMTEIIPSLPLNKLKMLLPFLKQGYTGFWATASQDVKDKMDFMRAGSFDEADLDQLIADMNKSTDPDTFEDIVDKRFFIPQLGKYIEVVRIEEWNDPRDQKIEMMGGLFGDLPAQFDKLQVAILKEDPITGQKFGMLVDKIREAINKGSFTEVPPYDNIEYRDALDKIIKGYQQIGMTDKAAELERQLWKEPKRALKKEGTWQEEIDRHNRQLQIAKEHDDYMTGRQMFDPLPEVPVMTTDQVLDIVNAMVKRGEPIDIYIKKYVPADLLQEVVDFHNEIRQIYGKLGFMPSDTPYFLKGFDAGSVVAALYPVGAKGRAVERERKGATKEQIDDAIGYLKRTLEDERKKLDITKASAMAWDIKYRFWHGKDFPKEKYAGVVAIAKEWGITGKQAIRDAYELALVDIARTYAHDATKDRHAKMIFIQSLYDTTPKISETARTAEVRELQQFSTPIPLGYLMGDWVNADVVDSVFEPQAGVGALLIAAKRGSVKANELDPKRFWRLLYQGYSATNFDSMHGIKDKIAEQQFDAVLMNPPFGGPKENYHGFELRGEYIPIAYNLEMLSDVGKAAFISGGHLEFDDNGWIKGAKEKTFINWLSKHYNIQDIIQLDGKLYEKMGTKYPVKVFLINGRKAAPESKPVNESDFNFIPEPDWNGVRFRIFNQITKPNERSVLQGKVDAERGDDSIVDGPNPTERPGKRDTGPDAVSEGPVPPTNRPGEGGSSGPPNTGLPGSSTGNVTEGPTPPDIERPGIPKSTGGTGSQVKGGFAGSFGEIPAPRSGEDLPVNNIGKPTERTKRDIGLSQRTGDEVTNYVPLSQNGGNQYTVPASLAPAIERALIMLQDEVGNVDEYVMKMLNYKSVDEFKKALFGAQVDGIGQAIYNIEQGEAMIIGHQTGSGKGRIAAGVAAYAIENGKFPVFITKSADLFTDIWRDFMGIGKNQYTPFIMNKKFASSGQKVRVFNQATGATIFESDEQLFNKVIGTAGSPGSGKIPDEFDMLFTTYSQFQNAKTDTAKREFLMNLARTKDVVFIMDESHSASGQSNTGEFFMNWIGLTGGGTFLSATYAKRPDNMPLYAMKSVMREANMPLDGMVDAITNGGPALQEILTMHLAEAGQFSKIGIQVDADVNYLILGDDDPTQRTYNPELGPEMVRKYDEVIDVIQDIIDFQRVYVTPLLKEMDKAIKREVGGGIAATTGTTQAGISNTPYFSRVWNIIDQLLMALKVDEMVPLLEEDLKKGIKPIVFVRSTMEAVFNEMKDMGELSKGDVIDMDFSYIFKRGMRTVMKYTETDEGNQKTYKVLDVEDLSPAGQEAYFNLIERIQEASTGINLSPIDVIRKKMEAAGYKTVELTGRDGMFELSDDLKTGKWVNNDRGDKIKAVATFNNNPDYVAIANTAATTGISMHPNKDVKDQSPRSSYFAQLFLNINEQIQAFGRTGRVGQLHRPIYNMMTSMLPAEKRAFMMIARKLKSLDANTSGNQKHSTNMVDVPDFLNKYGDEAVIEFLKDNPDINLLMGDPFNVDGAKDDTEIKVHNAAYRATGKIQILPSHLQEFFHEDVIERYNAKIEYLDSTGTNDLMVTSEPLDAVFDETETTIIGNGGWSKFGDDTNLQTAEVNVIRKPFTKEQLQAELDKVPGHAEGMHERNFEAAMNEGMDKRIEDALQKLEDQTAESKAMNKKRIMDKKKLDAAGKQREWELKAKEIDEHHQFRTEAILKDMGDLRRQFQQLINEFSVEKIYEVPFEATDQLGIVRMNKGMFLGFKINMDKPNPWIPSNIRMRFATLDSRKLIEIPTSKHQHIYSIASHSRHITEAEDREVRENWDQQKKGRDRETRYIATGNILQGMTKYAKGRLIEFNMKDGTQEVGIIMPENWKKPDEKVYRIPIKRATDIIKRLHPTEYIEDYRGDILIFKQHYSDPQWYELRVPASKARGQKYWSHEGLRALMRGNDFEQRGDRMVGEFPESRLDQVIEILDSRFKIALEAEGDNIQSAFDNTDSKQMEREYPGVVFRGPRDRGGLSHPDDPPGIESRKHTSERILPSPISGVKPKPIDQIQFDFGQALGGKDIRYRKRPAKGAIGAHTKGINLVAIKFNQDMDTASHELGHYMDIAFGLLGPEAYEVWDDLRSELEKIWDWGSQPQQGDPNPELTHMKEGLAEFIRALVVNPGVTKDMFPATYSWFKQRVSQNKKAWEGFLQFSHDVRVWHGATALQKIGSQMDLGVEDPTRTPLAFSRTSREGKYQTTIWDWMGNRIWFIYEASVGAWKWAMDKRGVDISDFKTNDPETNFEYLIRNALGFDVKAENIHYKGFVDFNRNRIYDDVTGEPMSWNLLFSAVPSYTWKDYKTNVEEVLEVMGAYRAVEIPWKLASKQARIDLSHVKIGDPATMVIPPLKILAKMPYVVKKYGSVINAVLKAIEDGDLDRDAAFWPEKRYTRFQNGTILGIAQEGEYDFKIAEEAVKEFEALEQSDPEKFAWMTEFMRVHQKISEWTVDYAVEAGLITPDLGEQIKGENLSYLMFKRAFNWSAKESVEGRDVSLNPLELDTSKGIPEIIFHGVIGSQKRIKHPIAEFMGFVHNLIRMADYNYALMSFAQAFQGWNASYEEGVTDIGEIAYVSSTKEPDGIPFKHNGNTFYLVIRNPEVRRNFNQILADDNPILRAISYLPRTLQRSIVTALQFMLRNTPRDIGGYIVYGQDQKYQRLKDFLPSEKDRDMFELSGGGQFGYVIRNKKGYMNLMKDIMILAAKDPKKWLHNPWKWTQHKRDQFVKAASISERLTRMLQFKAAVKAAKARGATDAGAYTYGAFQARDLTDFQAAGEYVKFLNQFIIFSGAAIRGLEKVARTTRQNPARMAKRFTLYALIPSLVNSLLIAAFASGEDQKRYINLPDYVKDMFYVIPAGDGWIIIPKPFEIGAAASAGQRLLDMIILGDEDAFSKQYLRSFNHLINPYDLAGIMGGFSGLAAAGFNYDFFRQKYIIPPHEKDLAVSSRITDSSSKFGQHIQKLSDFVKPGKDNPWVDARVVDAFVQSQFAYWGELFLKAYEGVTSIGDQDPIRRRWRFDVEDLALYKNDQVFGTPNVQWVLMTERAYPKEVKYIVGKGVDNFQMDLYYYLSDEVQNNPKVKNSEGAYIRDFAEMIKSDIEAYLKKNNTTLDQMATEDVEYRKSLQK